MVTMEKEIEDFLIKVENKEFHRPGRDGRAYDADEVDEYFDKIISAVSRLLTHVNELEQHNAGLKEVNNENRKNIETANQCISALKEELNLYKSEGYTVDRKSTK